MKRPSFNTDDLIMLAAEWERFSDEQRQFAAKATGQAKRARLWHARRFARLAAQARAIVANGGIAIVKERRPVAVAKIRD